MRLLLAEFLLDDFGKILIGHGQVVIAIDNK